MKNKIPIIVIIILLLGLGIIRYKILQFSNLNNSLGIVKSAQISLKNHNDTIPSLEKFSPLPSRKNNSHNPLIQATNYALFDIKTFYPLIEKNLDSKVPIASTTKIMTAVIALENYNLEDVVTISQNAATQIGSDIQLKTGEKITVKNLLYALLIKSGNDAAMALAEFYNPGGVTDFIGEMNKKAEFLSLKNTHYNDPAGLDDTGYSSVHDLAVLTNYAMRNKVFEEVVRIKELTISAIDDKFTHKLETSNRLIKPDSPFFLDLATGVKTGFTPDAGHGLVATAEKNGIKLISVILHTNENSVEASARESKKLIEWGFDNFVWKE